MDDSVITLQDAIKQVDEWMKDADAGCRAYRDRGLNHYYYTMYVSKWNAYKSVALLLSKIATKESE